MNLEYKRFRKEFHPEYTAWFNDTELNRRLGPMDEDWLNAVLSQNESEGITWAVFRDGELVAVVEPVFDHENQRPVGITAIAVKPSLRRQGFGTAVMKAILSNISITEEKGCVAFVSINNPDAGRFLEKLGFKPVHTEPDTHGYLEYRF